LSVTKKILLTAGPNGIKKLPYFTSVRNKLECLSLASFSSLF